MKKLLTLTILLLLSFNSFAQTKEVIGKCSLKNEKTKVEETSEQKLYVDESKLFDSDNVDFDLSLSSDTLGTVQLKGGATLAVVGDVVVASTTVNFKIPSLKLSSASMDMAQVTTTKGDISSVGSVLEIEGELYKYSCVVKVE